MRPLHVLLAAALALSAGCGPEIWTEEREATRAPAERALLDTQVRVDPLLSEGDLRRFSLVEERIYAVKGLRDVEVVEYRRPYSPFVEAGEMTIGIVLTPFWVLLFPVAFPIVAAVGQDVSVVEYFAVIPERFLNPVRNDLFEGDVSEQVVGRRQEPYEDRAVDVEPRADGAGGSLEILELRAIPLGEPERAFPVQGARLEEGRTLVFMRPPEAVEEYVLRVRLGETTQELRFRDY